jgi:zinc protease
MGYAPANATMVVVGNVTADEIFTLAAKYIEPIPSKALTPPVTTKEPEQMGERRIVIRKFAQLPIIMAAYHVPETSHPDYYPLQVLKTILFDGESSRMYQRLVDKEQIALSVDGGFGFAFDPTLFEIIAQPKEGIATETIEKALYEEIDRVKTDFVTDREIQKAKNILLANFYRGMKTINGKANALGSYDVFFGDYRKMFTAADAYSKVTKEDVQRVAKAYFSANNRTVATLIPEAEEGGKQ